MSSKIEMTIQCDSPAQRSFNLWTKQLFNFGIDDSWIDATGKPFTMFDCSCVYVSSLQGIPFHKKHRACDRHNTQMLPYMLMAEAD